MALPCSPSAVSTVPALNVPSKTPPTTSLCRAEMSMAPPATTVAPDATVTTTTGLLMAREVKTATESAPPPELSVLASASVVSSAETVTPLDARTTEPLDPSVALTFEAFTALLDERPTEMAPTLKVRMVETAASMPCAWTATDSAPLPAAPRRTLPSSSARVSLKL